MKNRYKSPSLVSYKAQDILEIIGPAQSQYVPMDVGGGWQEASLGSNAMEYKENISPETEIETINKTIV